jgi:hypothetical protein
MIHSDNRGLINVHINNFYETKISLHPSQRQAIPSSLKLCGDLSYNGIMIRNTTFHMCKNHLNPIENLWVHLKREKVKHDPTSKGRVKGLKIF